MKDSYGRPVRSLRISVTSTCNLDCVYCHQEGIEKSRKEMTPEEIERIVKIVAKHGVKKVKITGGEPLIRKDIVEIVEKISSIEGIKEVSMTTNATILGKKVVDLKEAGLKRVNVSLDTLDSETFSKLTNGGSIDTVVEGIKSAVEAGLNPVKLNMVVMKGINRDKIKDMIKFASDNNCILQLIGLMETEFSNEFYKEYACDLHKIVEELEEEAIDVLVRKFMQGRTRYVLEEGIVEAVFPMHNTEFCSNCTRIRVTADGQFKPCLMRNDNYVDFIQAMRNGATDAELDEMFVKAVNKREPYFKKMDVPQSSESAENPSI